MRLYATRRECEMILSGLYGKMKDLPMDELPEYQRLAQRILEVNAKQCKDDMSRYDGCTLVEKEGSN